MLKRLVWPRETVGGLLLAVSVAFVAETTAISALDLEPDSTEITLLGTVIGLWLLVLLVRWGTARFRLCEPAGHGWHCMGSSPSL